MLSAFASFGGRSILTSGFFRKPSVTPSFPTARLIPGSSAFFRPADASAFDKEFKSTPNAPPPKTAQASTAAARLLTKSFRFIVANPNARRPECAHYALFSPPRQQRLRAGVRDLNGDVRQGFIVLEPLPIERAVAGFVREHRHDGAQVSRAQTPQVQVDQPIPV